MSDGTKIGGSQENAEQAVEDFKAQLGPFVVAAEATRMPMLFTNARSAQNDIIYVNKSFLKLTGYAEADALGMPFHRLLANEADRVHMTLGLIAGKESSSVDLRCLRNDGTEFDAAVLASPVCNEEGQLQQYFISLIDLTEHVQRRLRGHLREAEIYEHAPGFIAFTEGPDHRFAFVNSAFETLVGRSDIVGQKVADALPELVRQGVIDILDEVYVSQERKVGKGAPIQLVRVPGGELERRYVDFLYEPVRDAPGAIVGVFCEGSDITDAQATSEKLHDLQAQHMHVWRINAMGTMAATLAHEINQPLAAIMNYVEGCANLLQQSGEGSEQVHEGLSSITSAADRAGKIIRHLREMTKRTAPVMAIFDLGYALEESVRLVRAGGCKDVPISIHTETEVLALGDKIQIEQVIIDLLRNACDAAAENPAGGVVFSHASLKHGKPCVVVCDNGVGFPAEMTSDVFDWVEPAKADGMGIGLSVCRTIAERHGGKIAVDNTGPSGTSVTFSLPPIESTRPKLPISETAQISA